MKSLEPASRGRLQGLPWTVTLEGTEDVWGQRGNRQEPGEQHLKASRDGIQMAVAKEKRKVAEPGWQRRVESELNVEDLKFRGISSRTLVLLPRPN